MRDRLLRPVGTFVDVFPHATVWSGPNNWGWYLLGTIRPYDWERFRANLARTYADSALYADIVEFDGAIAEPERVTSLYMWDGDSTRAVAGTASRITDDYPFTEFPLWRYAAGRRRLWHPRSTWLNRTQEVRNPHGDRRGSRPELRSLGSGAGTC